MMLVTVISLSILLVLSLVGNYLLFVAAQRQLQRVEIYEEVVNEFYERTVFVLNTMRFIDEKQMFESDDEVGTVFDQIVEIVNELRPFIYGADEDATTEEE